MTENTTSAGFANLNTSRDVTIVQNDEDDKVWGMPQFKENYGENLTEDEYLETVI